MTLHQAATDSVLWSPRQLRGVGLAHLLAIAIVQVAAYQTRNSSSFSEQSDWAALAVMGLLVTGVASAAWLLSRRRLVGRRRARLSRSAAAAFPTPSAQVADDSLRVATSVMTLYHRSDCLLVQGKGAIAAPAVDHQRSRRTPCAVCEA